MSAMFFRPVLAILKLKPVWISLCAIVGIGVVLPVLSTAVPLVFPAARAKTGSFVDVVEMREIGLLSIQRYNFSHVVKGQFPQNVDLEKSDIYVRWVMRGPVTVSLDFNAIKVSPPVDTNEWTVVTLPPLKYDSIIDEWIYYDSKGTKEHNPRNITSAMDQSFREVMDKEAKSPDRVDRAKKQAEKLLEQLCLGEKIKFEWLVPESEVDSRSRAASEEESATQSQIEEKGGERAE